MFHRAASRRLQLHACTARLALPICVETNVPVYQPPTSSPYLLCSLLPCIKRKTHISQPPAPHSAFILTQKCAVLSSCPFSLCSRCIVPSPPTRSSHRHWAATWSCSAESRRLSTDGLLLRHPRSLSLWAPPTTPPRPLHHPQPLAASFGK